MRILHTIPGRNWGGMEHRTLEQVRWLKNHDHDVWLATPEDGESYRRAQVMGLPVLPMNFDPPWRPTTIRALRQLVKDKNIQVIDAHVTRDAKAALACMDLCALVRSRHVNQPLKTSFVRRLQWRLADHIITVAECTREHLIEIGLADPKRSVSIGGWADERFFDLADPIATRTRLRTDIGLSAAEFVLICVGMLRPDKGQNHLIEALGLLKTKGLDLTTIFAGSATDESVAYEAALKRRAAELGLRTHFLGYRDDISELMQTADMVVIPSLTEAQPRVAVQAFATGKPVVASAVGGVPEIVKDGLTGWLVPPAEPRILADAIARVVEHPAEASAVAEGAGRMAQERMRFDHRMAETLAIYETAIARAKARPLVKVRP